MNRGIYSLLGAQFLSALADNAILFTAIALVMNTPGTGAWYIPALQGAFLLAFVALAPWVGSLADRLPKAHVLMLGNVVKCAGAGSMWLGVEPIAAYGLIGVGAAVYSPAKYGILPEMVGHEGLVQANGWIEGSTIAAIILGTVVGARAADASIDGALLLVIACYSASVVATFFIPRSKAQHTGAGSGIAHFLGIMRRLFAESRARFAMLGTSLFWATSAVLRLLLVAWAPVVLLTRNTADIADLTLALALGLVVGSLVVPRLVPIDKLRRARLAAYGMGLCVLVLASLDTVWPTRAVLTLIGFTGGLFVVPINAALQEIGHRTVGSGSAIAVQNFFENVAMIIAVGSYSAVTAYGATPTNSILATGCLLIVATFVVARRLPPDAGSAPNNS